MGTYLLPGTQRSGLPSCVVDGYLLTWSVVKGEFVEAAEAAEGGIEMKSVFGGSKMGTSGSSGQFSSFDEKGIPSGKSGETGTFKGMEKGTVGKTGAWKPSVKGDMTKVR